MGLCKACQSIPYHSLPAFPAYSFSSAHSDKGLAFLYDRETGHRPRKELGHLWHANLAALKHSSNSGCDLCTLAHTGTESWTRRYNRTMQQKHWIEFCHPTDNVLFEEGIWLSQRCGGGDGFVVVAAITETSIQGFTVLASIGLGVEAQDKRARQLLMPMNPDSGSKPCLDIAASWLKECHGQHQGCPTAAPAPMPSRILDVGTRGDIIHLLDNTSQLTRKYATLSYCWGADVTPMRTTQGTMHTHKAGISIRSLPRSFQDAVTIVRYIGLRYLWIDSLCIIQDDEEDWARESSRMTAVYSNADVMIAANRASDCDQGCFHARSSLPSTKIHIPNQGDVHAQLLGLEMEHFHTTNFQDEPLSKRGWALQERVLANRVLHYNNDQMYFECRRGILGENGSFDPFRYCNLDVLEDSDSPENKVSIRTAWDNITSWHGRRKLTRPTDKLPALSGLATRFSRKLDEPYIAGLWGGDLIASLSWQVPTAIPLPESAEYIGPSWSWAGLAGPAVASARRGWTDIARVLDWRVMLKNEANPFGEITAASLRVEAPLVKLRRSTVSDPDFEARLARLDKIPLPHVVTGYSDDGYGHIVSLDYRKPSEIHSSESWEMYMLLLGVITRPRVEVPQRSRCGANESYQYEEKEDRTFYGLVLVPADNAGLTMKRVGMVLLPGAEGDLITQDESCKQVTTLV